MRQKIGKICMVLGALLIFAAAALLFAALFGILCAVFLVIRAVRLFPARFAAINAVPCSFKFILAMRADLLHRHAALALRDLFALLRVRAVLFAKRARGCFDVLVHGGFGARLAIALPAAGYDIGFSTAFAQVDAAHFARLTRAPARCIHGVVRAVSGVLTRLTALAFHRTHHLHAAVYAGDFAERQLPRLAAVCGRQRAARGLAARIAAIFPPTRRQRRTAYGTAFFHAYPSLQKIPAEAGK